MDDGYDDGYHTWNGGVNDADRGGHGCVTVGKLFGSYVHGQ